MATFPLELVTPERMLFAEEVEAIRAPGVDGSMGVLAGHAPLLTELTTGLIKVTRADGSDTLIATSGGFLQVNKDKVIILADTAELAEEIDVERARTAAAKARQLLDIPGNTAEIEELRLAVERAQNRIRVAQMHQ